MATPYGQIVAFHPESDSIKAYRECVQLYFVANKTPEDVQVPIFLSWTGVPTYSLLSDLLAPSAPSSKSLQVNSEAQCNHFEPKQVVIAQHFYFHKCDQSEGESIADYDAKLRNLASHCNFGDYLGRHFATVLCVVFGMRQFNDGCSQKCTSPMQINALGIASAMEAADGCKGF